MNILNNNIVNQAGGFEFVDIAALNDEMAAENNAQVQNNVPPPENANRGNVLENAQVGGMQAPQGLVAELRGRVEYRHSLKNRLSRAISTVGRALLKFSQACKRFLCSAYRRHNVADFNLAYDRAHPAPGPRAGWKATLGDAEKITYSNEELAAGFGLRGPAGFRPFGREEVEGIRNGDFRLEHIRQKPSFQDCWFLSSVSALLRMKGPQALRDIIHVPNVNNPAHAFVKLGENVYKVPLGEVTGGDHRSVSNSEPWVRLLETAMQMHLIRTQPNNPRMAYRDTSLGLAALTGRLPYEIHNRRAGLTIAHLRQGVERGIPMVVGISGTSGAKNLGIGVASNHAVTVVDVMDDNHAVLMDPYGHTTVVHARDLARFTLFSTEGIEVAENAGQPANQRVEEQGQPQAAGPAGYVDNDGDDF